MDEMRMIECLERLGYSVERPNYTPELGDLFIDDDGDLSFEGPCGTRYFLTEGGEVARPARVDSIVPLRRVANVLEMLKVSTT